MSQHKLNPKLIGFIVLASVIVSVSYFVYPRETPPSFATQAVQRGNIEYSVLATGMVQASKLVAIGAQVSGQIETLAVALGDEIKQGDIVAQIDSLTQQNNLKKANASLNSLNAQIRAKQALIKQAQSEFMRQKGMLSANASSKADYEAAETTLAVYLAELEQLNAELEQAKIAVDSAKLDLGYTTIQAPLDGTVVYTAVEEGQTVNANQTTPTIIELAQLEKMTIKAQISEADIIHVQPGLPVYFTILGNANQRYHSTLRAIEPGPTLMDGNDKDLAVSNDQAIYYHGLFEVDNPDRTLRIGMTAQVSVVLNKAENVLLVPAQVLIRQPGRAARYQVPVLNDGKQVMRDVTVGINNKVSAEITSGLQEGDQIILGIPRQNSGSASPRMGPAGMRF
ncbi:efflux RND transporter periplasmic adaptor subunit [Vibrio sp. HDW18]|uniref:efflux RND transporter periplasmic adaptor subunit n=1 Tax=Vibrio sp. HDW18 TaxID=2714948 RepID=UPI00140C1438|nr:efflux RND transporter periplasmic adaptor subunit [Vibrio sp. HDW18]QIL84539.1 efflux RND transporter periplasmic adaptor subunit [Vibrio sp. HDW18]